MQKIYTKSVPLAIVISGNKHLVVSFEDIKPGDYVIVYNRKTETPFKVLSVEGNFCFVDVDGQVQKFNVNDVLKVEEEITLYSHMKVVFSHP